MKLFCLTNRKSGNQLWQLGSVHEIYIFLRGHVSFNFFNIIPCTREKENHNCSSNAAMLHYMSMQHLKSSPPPLHSRIDWSVNLMALIGFIKQNVIGRKLLSVKWRKDKIQFMWLHLDVEFCHTKKHIFFSFFFVLVHQMVCNDFKIHYSQTDFCKIKY